MDKKNFCSRSFKENVNLVQGYTYPVAHFGKKNYVDFYFYLPDTGEKKRVKKFFDSIKKKREMKLEMQKYIETIASQLRSGWRPFHENTTDRSYKKFKEILEIYKAGLSRYDRKKTVHNYSSRTKILIEYLSEHSLSEIYCYQFDRQFCIEFLDWLTFQRKVLPRTVNNYKGWLSSLAIWMIERNYIRTNPVEKIKKIRETEKIRQPLTQEQLNIFFKYLSKHDKPFLVACLFEYYTFIRPNELSHAKLQDISIQKQTIFVPGEVSKNHRDGLVSLNPTLIKMMLELGYFNYPYDYYIFGSTFKPSPARADADHFNKKWAYYRKILKFPEDLKFYSLKDSGIRDLANSKGVVVARDQARHTDIATTNKYLKGKNLSAPTEAKKFKGIFEID